MSEIVAYRPKYVTVSTMIDKCLAGSLSSAETDGVTGAEFTCLHDSYRRTGP